MIYPVSAISPSSYNITVQKLVEINNIQNSNHGRAILIKTNSSIDNINQLRV